MRFKIKVGEKEYDIELLETENEIEVRVGDKNFYFQKEKEPFLAKTKFDKRDFKEKKIFAPIGGIITEIFVKEGDVVKKGQKLFLLSAMKMENEILSTFDGKVKNILVKKKDSVKKDQVLLVGE